MAEFEFALLLLKFVASFGFKCECADGRSRDKRTYQMLDNCKSTSSVNNQAQQELHKAIECSPYLAGDNCELPLNVWSGMWILTNLMSVVMQNDCS